MKFKDIISVSGLPGLYEMMSAKPNGAVLRALQDGKTKFISNRIHTFSPLDKISMYTVDTDSEPLGKIVQAIIKFENEENGQIPLAKDKPDVLRNFMKTVLPNFDEDRVYVSDIQKLLKWYSLLKTVEIEFEVEEEDSQSDDATDADAETVADSTEAETKVADETTTDSTEAEAE